MFLIILKREHIEEAVRLGTITHAHWQEGNGHYRNRLRSHITGKLGEIAFEQWLQIREIPFHSLFRDLTRERECDIVAATSPTVRLEVKTWGYEHWPQLGRCVAVNQMNSIARKADKVVWCLLDKCPTFPSDLDHIPETLGVTVKGWSLIEDIRNAPRRFTGRDQIHNHQLDEADLRDMSTLLATHVE